MMSHLDELARAHFQPLESKIICQQRARGGVNRPQVIFWITPVPEGRNVWTLLTSSVCFCTGESDGRHVGVSLCMWRSVALSVLLDTLQSMENELQLQALPPNGGSVHMCIYALCVCVCVADE